MRDFNLLFLIMNRRKKEDEYWLIENYANKWKEYCARKLNKTISSIRAKSSKLKLKLNTNSDFYRDFQKRAALSKVWKKRPAHSSFMKKQIELWNMPHVKNPSIETKKKIWIASKKSIKEKWHPKWMLWKKHTTETKKKFSNRDIRRHKKTESEKEDIMDKMLLTKKRRWNWNNHIKSWNAYSRTKSWKRKDLDDVFFRSATEANFARWLNLKNIKYIFEPKTFYFSWYKRWTLSYTPDFYIPELDIRYEVKWRLDSKSITKIKRFKKQYPKEFSKLYIVKQW